MTGRCGHIVCLPALWLVREIETSSLSSYVHVCYHARLRHRVSITEPRFVMREMNLFPTHQIFRHHHSSGNGLVCATRIATGKLSLLCFSVCTEIPLLECTSLSACRGYQTSNSFVHGLTVLETVRYCSRLCVDIGQIETARNLHCCANTHHHRWSFPRRIF